MKTRLAFKLILLFSVLVTAEFSFADSELNVINRARNAYGKGQFEKAVQLYTSIPKKSDWWPRAIEERAHTYGKMRRYENAIADFTTLFSPVFIDSVTPEAYFSQALTYLRICQYKKVYESISNFKSRMRHRIRALELIRDRKADAVVLGAVRNLKEKGFTSLSYAKDTAKLPLLFHRDHIVRSLIATQLGENTQSRILNRVSVLASQDLAEISRVLDQMQLVEAELIQDLHIAESEQDLKRNKSGKFVVKENQLEFPYDGEVWIDELDSYQVQTRRCPSKGNGV